jgi:serine/threonine-protein kinase
MAADAKYCKKCSAEVSNTFQVCPYDGGALADRTADPMVGTVFAEKYEIEAVLGRGGMSTVFKARHQLMNRNVAVKLMKDQLLQDPVAVERFKREAQSVSALNHRNVVTVFDFGVSNGMAFLVMDYLDGPTLNHLIQQEGHIVPSRAVPIFSQICDALDHAHSKNIVHRDLKPANICLVEQDGQKDVVKIVDFGLAKLVGESGGRALTRPGQVFGSPLYISPEQCQAKPLDARADIYSLGCLMYESLTGMPPFLGDTSFETMNKHCLEAPPAMATVAADLHVPPELEAVVLRALEKDPQRRWQTAAEMRAALPVMQQRQSSLSLQPVVPAKASPNKFAIVAGLVAMMLVFLAIAVLTLSHWHN